MASEKKGRTGPEDGISPAAGPSEPHEEPMSESMALKGMYASAKSASGESSLLHELRRR